MEKIDAAHIGLASVRMHEESILSAVACFIIIIALTQYLLGDTMLSVKEAATMLGVSPTRVRKLIADGEMPAQKVGNAWTLEEKDVLERASRHPKAGRPHKRNDEIVANLRKTSRKKSDRVKKAKRLFQECKEVLSVIPDAAMISGAESAEEAAFYIAASDFFLQQKQHELIRQGVF